MAPGDLQHIFHLLQFITENNRKSTPPRYLVLLTEPDFLLFLFTFFTASASDKLWRSCQRFSHLDR